MEEDVSMSDESVENQTVRQRRRLVGLLLIGVLVVGLGLTWQHYRYARPIGVGPAGPTVPREAFANVWSERPVVLLGLGDSVTQGLGASPGLTYFTRLHKNPPDEFPEMNGLHLRAVFPHLEPVNLAISGTTSIECVDYQLAKLQPYDTDTFGVVVMTTGGNDVIHNYGRTPPREGAMYGARINEIGEWVTNFSKRLDTIRDRLRETFPGGCHLFVANIYDPTDGDGDIVLAGLPAWPGGLEVIAAYNKTIAEFAERHEDVTLIDMRKEFLGHGVHCTHFWHREYRSTDPHYWYWDNLEDPNDRGYDAIRRLFLTEMSKTLPQILQTGQ
jgi:lysophospholipase L1-like esterase